MTLLSCLEIALSSRVTILWLSILAFQANAIVGPIIVSEFDGQASFAPCRAWDVTDDGNGAAFDCAQVIYYRPQISENSIILVSKTSDGFLPNGPSINPSISLDGSQIVYTSLANDIVDDDTNDSIDAADLQGFDVFLYDLATDTNTRVAFDRFGAEVPFPGVGYGVISPDFRHITIGSRNSLGFALDTNNVADLVYQDRESSSLELIAIGMDGSVGSEGTFSLGISDDGNQIFLRSANDNLVAGDTNQREDLFVFRRDQQRFEIIVRQFDGQLLAEAQASLQGIGDIRGDGRFVVFTYSGEGLVPGISSTLPQIYLTDIQTGITQLISTNLSGAPANGASYNPQVSTDGEIVAFSSDATDLVLNDTNGFADVFVRDVARGNTNLVSRSADGEPGDGQSGGDPSFEFPLTLSRNGHFLTFTSEASNFTELPTNGVRQVYLINVIAGLPQTPMAVPAWGIVALFAAVASLLLFGSIKLRTLDTRSR